MRLIGKKNIGRAAQFEFIQEVLFHSNVVTNRGKYVQVSLNVYEWVDGSYQIVAYNQANMPKNTKYGEVLYKLTNVKGNVIFLRKSDIRG